MIKYRNIMVLLLMITILAVAGCSGNSAQKKPTSTTSEKPKAPTELKSISEDLDTLITQLDKKLKTKKMPMQANIQLNPQKKTSTDQSSTTNQSQSQSGQSAQGSSSSSQTGTSQSNSQSQSSQSQAKQTEQDINDWQKEYSSVRNIHTSWNSLMPEAVEAGMTTDARTQFGKVLDQLTQDISSKNLENSMTSALLLYKQYADMSKFFTNSVPAEFWQLKYEIMATVYEASNKNWTAAETHLPKIRENWLYLGAQTKSIDSKLLSRIDFSIMDLDQAIKDKQLESSMIKGEIAMNNLKSLQDKLASQSSGQSGQSGSDNK